ncbi:NUDIX hydrolase [bacterium]|nr:NUDIX hydrolase [bacterium]
MSFLTFPLVSLIVGTAAASSPNHACRVMKPTLQQFATVENNAGCVIHRIDPKTSEVEFLLVYVEKGDDKGWSLPGGKPATKKNDVKEGPIAQALAARVPYDYSEPAVCTASRETFEETGMEVVVEELIEQQEKFLVFKCSPVDPGDVLEDIKAIDTREVHKTTWATLKQAQAAEFPLRFVSDRALLQKAHERIVRE